MPGSTPHLAQRGWAGDLTASQKEKVPEVPIEEFLRMKSAPWHSTTNGGLTIQTAEFRLTVSAPAWTLTPDGYRASREASGCEFMCWSQGQFDWTDEDLRAVERGENGVDNDESEEWQRRDDATDDDGR